MDRLFVYSMLSYNEYNRRVLKIKQEKYGEIVRFFLVFLFFICFYPK
jgi:hypothetical protein